MHGTRRDTGHTPTPTGAKPGTGSCYPYPTGANTCARTSANSVTRTTTGTGASPIPLSTTRTGTDARRNCRPRNIC